MKVANAAAATRGASAEFAVFASVTTCPDMCTPICAARYVISIEERLQLAFLALTLAPAISSRSKSCHARRGRHQGAILSFDAGHVLIAGTARSRLEPIIAWLATASRSIP